MQEENCKSQKSVLKRNIITTMTIVVILTIIAIVIGNIRIYDKPEMDKLAEEGVPTVEEKYEYSTLIINDGYEIGLCAKPKINEENIELYITNMKSNYVWLKAQIVEGENVIGETGIIKPNQFVKNVKLKEKVKSKITVKIVEYEIDTYNSKGIVTLEI